MAPTMMFKDGKLELVTGSPGGSTIITTVLQIILDTVDFGLNLAEATAQVRVHDQLLPDVLFVERGLNLRHDQIAPGGAGLQGEDARRLGIDAEYRHRQRADRRGVGSAPAGDPGGRGTEQAIKGALKSFASARGRRSRARATTIIENRHRSRPSTGIAMKSGRSEDRRETRPGSRATGSIPARRPTR